MSIRSRPADDYHPYSSMGSNDGQSPPPEMALLSGVPPAGLTGPKPVRQQQHGRSKQHMN